MPGISNISSGRYHSRRNDVRGPLGFSSVSIFRIAGNEKMIESLRVGGGGEEGYPLGHLEGVRDFLVLS